MSELIQADTALSVLLRCLDAVRAVRRHGIAPGPWLEREEWLNRQVAQLWTDRGSFPGLGSALEALGLRMGTALAHELLRTQAIGLDDDPWPVIDALLQGQRPAPAPYRHDIDATRATWLSLPAERRMLLHLLSRFALLPEQAARWFSPEKREKAGIKATDADIIQNPYRVAELDTGGREALPVSLGVIDRGLLPDSAPANRFPIPEPSFVGSPRDPRRIRAAIVAVLRQAAADGDSLLVADESVRRVSALGLRPDPDVTLDWIHGNSERLEGVVESVELPVTEGQPGVPALQLTPLKEREDWLRRNLLARARRRLDSFEQDWASLLRESIGPNAEINDAALAEQAEALERVTTSKLSLLLGRAGTGKTSTLGALLRCQPLLETGALLLAPTGKARVKMTQASGREAKTVAQFLYQQGMYDPVRQVPLFEVKEPYKGARTVIIDECSMLTMDDLAAILRALDLGHVQRIILVGDPNQLPPIGVGRPFADLAGHSESSGDEELERAIARLTHEVRTVQHERSDSLRLAAWFMRGEQAPGADRILVDLETGMAFNDLSVRNWKTPGDLRAALLDEMRSSLGIEGAGDVEGFDRALGLDDRSFANFGDPDGAERFQVLSPVRMHEHGVAALNRWMQTTFRGARLASARKYRKPLLGDEEIGRTDKVIQVRNETRECWSPAGGSQKQYLANGEVGIAVTDNRGFLNVLFADRPNVTFGYHPARDFGNGSGPLELAYALTVHKAQGSQFKVVFVVIPERTRLLRRELLYTALTRSSERLVLLVQGDSPGWLFDLSKPAMSETLRRNTNLFVPAVRLAPDELPYAQHLIHRADNGTMVRSKSELVIANKLLAMGIPFRYEEFLAGNDGTRVLPDFAFVDAGGDRLVWEHLGMLDHEGYRRSWEWKREWYRRNGFIEGQTLFTTRDDERGGLDSTSLTEVANRIRALL